MKGLELKLGNLWVLVGTSGMTGKPEIYSKIFLDKEKAEELAKEFRMEVKPAFINETPNG